MPMLPFGGPHAFSCEEVRDADGDGYRPTTGDCDDTNPERWPFHDVVLCDGVDQDCDGLDVLLCGDDDSAHPVDSGCGCAPSACAIGDGPEGPWGLVLVAFILHAVRRRRAH